MLECFENTTVDVQQVRAFLVGYPDYYGIGWDQKLSENTLKALNYLDFFEFHFRRYLIGYPKTMRRVYEEVRVFMAHDADTARKMIALSMDAVQATILQNEWYELMPRHQTARSRIEKRFGPMRYDLPK